MRFMRVKVRYPPPFINGRDTISQERVEICEEIQAQATHLNETLVDLQMKPDAHIYVARRTIPLEGHRGRIIMMRGYLIVQDMVPRAVTLFGDLHKFALDTDGNFYHFRFMRDWKCRSDMHAWWPLGDLRTCYFQDDLLGGYLLGGLARKSLSLAR